MTENPDGTVTFNEIELAMIDKGIAELDAGLGIPIDEAFENARRRAEEWIKTNRQIA